MTCEDFLAGVPRVGDLLPSEVVAMMRHLQKCAACKAFTEAGAAMGRATLPPEALARQGRDAAEIARRSFFREDPEL